MKRLLCCINSKCCCKIVLDMLNKSLKIDLNWYYSVERCLQAWPSQDSRKFFILISLHNGLWYIILHQKTHDSRALGVRILFLVVNLMWNAAKTIKIARFCIHIWVLQCKHYKNHSMFCQEFSMAAKIHSGFNQA